MCRFELTAYIVLDIISNGISECSVIPVEGRIYNSFPLQTQRDPTVSKWTEIDVVFTVNWDRSIPS